MAEAKPDRIVLALNSGSSSLKFGLYRVGAGRLEVLLSGEAEEIGGPEGRLHAQGPEGELSIPGDAPVQSQGDAVARIARLLAERQAPAPEAIGHRIVHGGPRLRAHGLIDASVMAALEAAIPFAPLHLPAAIDVIRFSQTHFPGLPQAACFDTAFHITLPDVARVLPVAKALQREGVQRYGFHGLSCESILHQLGPQAPDRLIVAHLGAGASLTAVKAGRSIDTSMGLTPTGGVMMGTRSGDLDPGVLIYLARENGLDAGALETLVDHRSGLLGVSGLSSDLRRLHAASPSSPAARLAIDMFCYAVRKQVAGMTAALEGLDLLVFTGGIGEHDALVRASVCTGMGWLGIGLDEANNRSAANPISTKQSRCRVMVLPSQEDEQIARHSWTLT